MVEEFLNIPLFGNQLYLNLRIQKDVKTKLKEWCKDKNNLQEIVKQSRIKCEKLRQLLDENGSEINAKSFHSAKQEHQNNLRMLSVS